MGDATHPADLPTQLAPPAAPRDEGTTPLTPDQSLAGTESYALHGPTPHDVPSASAAVAARVGKYLILAEQGTGGMGVVYQALDPDLHRVVALKMIRSGAMARPKEIHRFLQESAALARVKHANIVPVHDAGQFEGQPFFVMEFLAGGSLSKNLARYKEDARLAVGLIAKLARAVHQLHQHNMVHRDLKPANVLLDDTGEPYITDFGLVKLLDTTDNLTRSNQGLGTPSYMAPEQTALTRLRPGPQTDIWALGIMLYELLAGSRPFAAQDRAELFRQIINDDPPRPSAAKTGFDMGLEAVMLKCLEKDPAHRFATAAELADELERWLKGEPLRTRPETGLRRVKRFARKHPMMTVLVSLVLVAAVLAPVVLYLRSPERVLEEYHQKLFRGETVTLVPEKGMPRYARALRDDAGTILLGSDGTCTINAWDVHFVELMKELPRGGFRLRAKVRHLKTNESRGEVGLYFAYSSPPLTVGKLHRFFHLTYNDLVDQSAIQDQVNKQPVLHPPNSLHFRPSQIFEIQGNWSLEKLVRVPSRDPYFHPAKKDAPWRNLVVEIRPEQLQAWFEDKKDEGLGVTTLAQANKELDKHNKQRRPADPFHAEMLTIPSEFQFRGGLGLFVLEGSADFANVIVEPLPD